MGIYDTPNIRYSHSGNEIPIHLSNGKYVIKYIDPINGIVSDFNKSLKINGKYMFSVPDKKTGIYWFCKK